MKPEAVALQQLNLVGRLIASKDYTQAFAAANCCVRLLSGRSVSKNSPILLQSVSLRGHILSKQHKFSEAQADLDLVLRIQPTHVPSLVRRCRLHLKQGKFDSALVDLLDLGTIFPDAPLMQDLKEELQEALEEKEEQHYLLQWSLERVLAPQTRSALCLSFWQLKFCNRIQQIGLELKPQEYSETGQESWERRDQDKGPRFSLVSECEEEGTQIYNPRLTPSRGIMKMKPQTRQRENSFPPQRDIRIRAM